MQRNYMQILRCLLRPPICVRNCCFYRDQKTNAPSDKDLAPPFLAVLQKLRDWAAFFRKGTTRAKWASAHLGGKKHAMLHFDSSADWGTTLELVERARKLMDDMILFSGKVSDPPPLPTKDEWDLLEQAD